MGEGGEGVCVSIFRGELVWKAVEAHEGRSAVAQGKWSAAPFKRLKALNSNFGGFQVGDSHMWGFLK